MIKHINIKGNNRRDKKGILQQFLSEAQKYKPLTYEQEKTATREQLIKHNMLFAVSVAFRYDNSQTDIMDLISEAMIGLIKAADTYNPKYENKFISFALFQIQRYVKDYIDTKKNNVYLPYRINNIKYEVSKSNEVDVEKLAAKFKTSEYLVNEALSLNGFVSLDDTNEDGDNLYQIASDERSDKFIQELENKELYNEIIECLTERELQVLQMRYFDPFPQELEQVGKKLKMSRETVRQIQNKAFNKIKNKYANGI
jgi:RNA polymerase sigma factor (sigma-70 family)